MDLKVYGVQSTGLNFQSRHNKNPEKRDKHSDFAHHLGESTRRFKGNTNASEVCPDCGGRLARESGCVTCYSCGWSACS